MLKWGLTISQNNLESLDNTKFISPDLKEIFKTFLYLGLTAFGGLLMIVNINKKIVKEKQWFSDKEFLLYLANWRISGYFKGLLWVYWALLSGYWSMLPLPLPLWSAMI
jgi:hypothetical protein